VTDDPAIEIERGYVLTSHTDCRRCGHRTAFAVLVATEGNEWEDGEPIEIDEPIFINEPCDLPEAVSAQLKGLVPSIAIPDDDPTSYLRNHCSNCDAPLDDWHLCKPDGPLIAGDGSPVPGATATRLAGTPFVLHDCGVTYSDVQALLDAARKPD